MIRIKFEVEEQETRPLPIESENVGSPSDDMVVTNKKPTKIEQSIQQQDTDSVAVGSKSIKTEPAESSLSLTTQLNHSLNIQRLLRQNRILKGWTTNESTSSIGTKQQQQQFFLLPKIEQIVPEIHQEVPLSLDLSSLIPTSDSEETSNYDTAELPSLDQSASILIETQQQQSILLPKIEPIVSEIHQEVPLLLDQSFSSIPIETQQQSILLPKIEPIVPEIHQEVPLLLDQSSSILNPNSGETTATNCDTTEVPLLLDQSSSNPNPDSVETTTTNCDITTTEMFSGPRAGLGRRAKLNVCYSVPMEPNPVPRRRKKLPEPSLPSSPSADNSELASNDNDQHSGSGLISVLDPSTSSTTAQVAAPTPPPEEVPLLVGKKPLCRVPFTLEEKKARKRERDRLWYHRHKTNPKLVDPEIMAEMQRRKSEYHRRYLQQRLANATPKQLELILEKDRERVRRLRENESEEQRQRRLERVRQYKQRMKQKTLTPEEREKKRATKREENYRYRNRKKESLEESQIGQSQTSMSLSSINLVVMDNSESSTLTLNQLNHSLSTITSDNNGIGDIGTTISKRKRKPNKKDFELSMDDSDSFHFDIDGGGNGDEESNSQTTTLESPKPGPSKKLPRPTRNLKSQIYLEPSTDSDDSD